jgi:integrase
MTPTRKRSTRAARAPGIEIRHSRGCPAASDGPCTCAPTFRAIVYSQRDARKIQQTFPTLSAAKIWRQDALVDLRRGKLRATPSATLREVAEQWLQDAAAGTVLNRSGDRYKPSVVRGYEQALRTYVLPDLGAVQLGALQRRDVQALAERIARSGKSPSTVRNALLPLRAICRRALARGEIHDNPTRGLELPAVRGRRDRIAEPREAAALLSALETKDRRLWATAIYAGLRRGELQALRWGDVDLDASDRPFEPWTVTERARRAWSAAGLTPITLHECRHTYASLMIAAGVNPKALQTFMGHASITITMDRYGKLFPGSEDRAAVLLNAYLEQAHV